MLRNIPNKYTQNTLLEEIHEAGFVDTYDFFYLPMDVHNRANVGYAFINFLDSADFVKFTTTFTDYIFQKHPSLKIARVSPAHIQGLVENLQHFSNRAVTWSRNSQYRPIVRYHGVHRDLCELLAELPVPSPEPKEARSLSDPTESSSHLNPEAAEFVPSSISSGHSGVTENSGLSPDAGVFVPQAFFAMPEMDMGMPVEMEEQVVLAMQDMPDLCLGAEKDTVILNDMESAVIPPPGLEGHLFLEHGYFSFDEVYANCEGYEQDPEFDRTVCHPQISTVPTPSFTLDKEGLQEAVSQWLREGRQTGSLGSSSSTRSSSNGTTPRSVGTPSDLEKVSVEVA